MSNFVYIIGISIVLLAFSYNWGFHRGESSIAAEINKSNQIIQEIQNNNHKKELEYINKVKELENDIKIAEINYSNSISDYSKLNADRLLQSENRAQYYRKQAESCSSQSRDFAEYTARLDKQLTEGIYLVRELTELIRYRDQQLKQVGAQLQLDRELINK